MEKFLMTPEGHSALEQKLSHLRSVERYKIVKDIEEARAHGDISENSEYEDAKERQAMCEGIIQDIEVKLSRAEVIDVTMLRGQDLADDDEEKRVVFGSTIVVEDEDENELIFRIVGTDQANVDKGWISYLTPVAKALLGKAPGDDVVIKLPSKVIEYEILSVSYL
jgi:transcription elongation factor GreA